MNNIYLLPKSPKEIERGIAANLRAIRRRRKISQRKLAEMSDVSLGSLRRFESTGDISLLSLCKIAMALDVDRELQKLFSEVPPQSIEELIRGQD